MKQLPPLLAIHTIALSMNTHDSSNTQGGGRVDLFIGLTVLFSVSLSLPVVALNAAAAAFATLDLSFLDVFSRLTPLVSQHPLSIVLGALTVGLLAPTGVHRVARGIAVVAFWAIFAVASLPLLLLVPVGMGLGVFPRGDGAGPLDQRDENPDTPTHKTVGVYGVDLMKGDDEAASLYHCGVTGHRHLTRAAANQCAWFQKQGYKKLASEVPTTGRDHEGA